MRLCVLYAAVVDLPSTYCMCWLPCENLPTSYTVWYVVKKFAGLKQNFDCTPPIPTLGCLLGKLIFLLACVHRWTSLVGGDLSRNAPYYPSYCTIIVPKATYLNATFIS